MRFYPLYIGITACVLLVILTSGLGWKDDGVVQTAEDGRSVVMTQRGGQKKMSLQRKIYRTTKNPEEVGPLTREDVEESCDIFKGGSRRPMMHAPELQVYVRQLEFFNFTGRYFEWGTGGSTAFAAKRSGGVMYSFENHDRWCEQMMRTPYYKCLVEMGKLEFSCVTPVKTKMLGKMKNIEDRQHYEDYVMGINDIAGDFDVILVDGRFRAACALAAFTKMHASTSLMVHDYGREEYHMIEEWYDVIERTGAIGAFRKKDTAAPTRDQIITQMLKSDE